MWKRILLGGGLISLIGCATITRGVEEVFVVESNPVGAKVTLTYDEPVILSVEENQATSTGGIMGVDAADKKTITLTKLEGMTPATFKIPRRGSFTVRIEKEGYNPVVTHVETQMATAGGAALAGNVCIGGCLGAAVDAGSGATLEHVPSKVSVTLERAVEPEQKEELFPSPRSKKGVPLSPEDDGYKAK
jgi:hypothetical protein